MTTLYRALRIGFETGQEKVKHVALDVDAALEAGEVDESHLALIGGAHALGEAAMAKKGKVLLTSLLDKTTRQVWTNAYAANRYDESPTSVQRVLAEIDDAIPAFGELGSYEFPTLSVSEDAPLDVVVDIFENMNRRGQRLNRFDLMVARLYKPLSNKKYYDLRKSWLDLLAMSPDLVALGVSADDGMLPLQLIAMQVARYKGSHAYNVRGLSNKDVLELPAEQIIGTPKQSVPVTGLTLVSAVKALNDAAKFLIKHCGVIAANLLPQQSMLIPLADQYLRKPSERLRPEDMRRWFFAAGLSNRYYGSVNSYAQSDCLALAAWADGGAAPTFVSEFNRKRAMELNLRQPFSREGNILGSTLMALLISAGALDWRTGQLAIAGLNEDVQFHHMVPEKTLKTLDVAKDNLRPIAALTPITASRNAAIRDQNPSQVLDALKRDAGPIISTHLVKRSELEAGQKSKEGFQEMVNKREKRLREFVVSKLAL